MEFDDRGCLIYITQRQNTLERLTAKKRRFSLTERGVMCEYFLNYILIRFKAGVLEDIELYSGYVHINF